MARRNADATTGEIEPKVADTYSEAQGLDSPEVFNFEDLEALADQEGGLLTFKGSPWTVTSKEDLLGIPFIIADIRFYSGKFGDAVAVMIVTKDKVKGEDHLVFNDGSTGVKAQVDYMVSETGRKAPILCPGGLRKSDYKVTISDPFGNDADKEVDATTYYIA